MDFRKEYHDDQCQGALPGNENRRGPGGGANDLDRQTDSKTTRDIAAPMAIDTLHAVSTMVNRTDHDFASDTYYPARDTLQALAMRSVRSTEIMQMSSNMASSRALPYEV